MACYDVFGFLDPEYDINPCSQTLSTSQYPIMRAPSTEICLDVICKSNFQFQSTEINITDVDKDKKVVMEAACTKLTEKYLSYICDMIKLNEKKMTDAINDKHINTACSTIDQPAFSKYW